MLADTKTILIKAHQQNYAVGHFNINNMEIVQAVVQAAAKLKSPVILAVSEGAIEYAGLKYLYALTKTASELNKIPIALHLDHGQDLDIIQQCIQLGFSSVMIDASHFHFEKNVAVTKKVVQMAHRKGVSVEAELGTIGGKEDSINAKNIIYTDPQKAKEFVDKTDCDFLAVAIGTSHGAYKFAGRAKLKIDILTEIKKMTNVPLVLHGASGVPNNIVKIAEKYGADLSGVKGVPDIQLKQAIKHGINKVNTDTDIRIAFDAAVRKATSTQPKDFDPRHILAPARELISKIVEQRIRTFGSVNKV